jgi:SEC-C motif
VAKIGRNERCPCGSGVKSKRCCGTRAAQAEFDTQASALVELMSLPALFPQLRPRGEAFASWAERVAAEQLDSPSEEGLALLEPAERERIERGHAQEHPQVWRSLVEELGSEELARTAVVRGAVAAGVWERGRPLNPWSLALLEESSREDAADSLSFVLDARDLWSAFESGIVDDVLAELDDGLDDEAYDLVWNATVAEYARRFRGNWHDDRLAELVARVRSRLPLQGYTRACTALALACEGFKRDGDVRDRLPALLLAESVCRVSAPLAPPLAA